VIVKIKVPAPDYIDKAKLLTEADAERLLSRMSGKLPRRLDKDKLSREEALALQLEIEDENLEEWREKMAKISGKSKNS
jgi:N-acyl-L-homoserine lactone synthetase